ncbi:hypothetical protein CRE_23588 [Caenorhabditis remanei]|uniref:Uncharacterized protein n=1 Tax=Caenorhabditis remanei TaxID=31234 RepID=E3MVX9_CAERE|nr:hypothetical protein CRE_23588 [Caenorhabditis remanei]
MNRKPLNHDCFEVVLQYFESNNRILLSTHCSAIRNAYKRCPLKIEKLKLNPYSIQINDTEYRLGVIYHFPNGNTPKCYERDNNEGGVQLTIDRYGVTDKLSENTLTPGDINLDLVPNRPLIEYENLEIIRFVLSEFEKHDPTGNRSKDQEYFMTKDVLEQELRRYDRFESAEDLNDLKLNEYVRFEENEDIVDFVNLKYKPRIHFFIFFGMYRNISSQRGKIYTCVGKPALSIAHSMISKQRREYLTDKLYALILPLEPLVTPFDCYIQMTISSPRGITKERLIIDRKLPEAMKYLMKRILGTRRDFLHVKNLEIYDKRGILRLEENLRFKVENLILGSGISRIITQVKHIFDESSFPLKSIEIYEPWRSQIAHDSVMTNAELIYLSGYPSTSVQSLLEFQNRSVRVRFSCFQPEYFMNFIEEIVKNPREIGTCFSFGFRSRLSLKKIWRLIKKRLYAKIINRDKEECCHFPHRINYPLRYESELNVSGEESTDPEAPWFLNIEVTPIGSAFSSFENLAETWYCSMN